MKNWAQFKLVENSPLKKDSQRNKSVTPFTSGSNKIEISPKEIPKGIGKVEKKNESPIIEAKVKVKSRYSKTREISKYRNTREKAYISPNSRIRWKTSHFTANISLLDSF